MLKRIGRTLAAALAVFITGTMAATAAAPAKVLIPNQYIVVLKAAPGSLTETVLGERAIGLLTQVGGGTVLQQYQSALSGFAAIMSASQAAMMARLPGVLMVVPDQVMRKKTTQTGATWGLDRIDQTNLPLNGQYIYPTQAGAGVHVYVLDTGINKTHTDFTGRIGAGRNFAPNTAGTVGQPLADQGLHPDQLGLLPIAPNYGVVDDVAGTKLFGGKVYPSNVADCEGHGTHVSGTIAGTRYGVAKKATLHPVRVLGCTGSGATSGIIAGIDWVKANAIRPAVANMSLGGGDDEAMDLAVKNAINAGIAFVVAAGNDAGDACSGSPNRLPEAITVGATEINDAMASYSNYGTCIDIFAPGSGIVSDGIADKYATATLDGTSMASPHVAGAAALVLGATTTLTPTQVRDTIVGNSTLGKITGLAGNSPNALLHVSP